MWIPGLGRYRPAAGNRVGDIAPDFELPDQDGLPVKLSQFAGRPVALVFYPRANSMVCTRQMCSLRDDGGALSKRAVVLGISYDKTAALQRFITEDRLPFSLLSDEGGKVARTYGVHGLFGAARVTFVIGADGKIAAVINDVKSGSHAAQILAALG